jgi:beta-lactamase superfamily II metal-dependent hydrolase
VISEVSASDITTSTATITWTTNEPATSQVEHGETVEYGNSAPLDKNLVTNHSVKLSGLESNTTYHFRVKSRDAAGNEAVSEDNAFATAQHSLDTLTVHFIDVGQGDSILIDIGDIEVLIDGGGKTPGVVEYLNDYVDGALEVMIATHPHADHVGGLIAVLDAFEVEEIWHNGDTSTSQIYADFMAAVEAEGAQVHVARRGNEIQAGGLTFTVLNPATLAGTTNNNSIVLSLSYGEVDFLFAGDAEQEAEADMVAAGIIPDVEILKVGHHGSRTASSESFLEAAQPEIAIYMAGAGNSYGHPHAETISTLQAIGASIYGTDVYGTILVSTTGQTYVVLGEA